MIIAIKHTSNDYKHLYLFQYYLNDKYIGNGIIGIDKDDCIVTQDIDIEKENDRNEQYLTQFIEQYLKDEKRGISLKSTKYINKKIDRIFSNYEFKNNYYKKQILIKIKSNVFDAIDSNSVHEIDELCDLDEDIECLMN
jgi:hypothetical protein